MATYTTNYNLEKPEASDPFGDFRESYNDNLDIIDANLGGGGGGDSVSWTQIQASGTKIAEIDINGTSQNVYAPSGGGGGGDSVSWTQLQLSGTKIAEIEINGNTTNVYAPSGGGGGGSVIYSLSEQVVGTWIDNKPLYSITLNPTVVRGGNTLNHGIVNLENCVRIFGVCKYNNTGEQLPVPYVSTNINYMVACGNVTPTTYLVDVGPGFSSIQDCYITLFYTKTTD